MSDFIWVEKYRPTTIDECILPKGIKKTFQDTFIIPLRVLNSDGKGKTSNVVEALEYMYHFGGVTS